MSAKSVELEKIRNPEVWWGDAVHLLSSCIWEKWPPSLKCSQQLQTTLDWSIHIVSLGSDYDPVTFHFIKEGRLSKTGRVIRPRLIKTVLLQTTVCLVFHPNEEKVQSQDNLAWWLQLASDTRVQSILEILALERESEPKMKTERVQSWAAGNVPIMTIAASLTVQTAKPGMPS